MRTLLAALLLLPSVAEARPLVAVFDIEDASAPALRRTPQVLEGLRVYLEGELQVGGKVSVVPREQIQKSLKDLFKRPYMSCFEARCQFEVGHHVDAAQTVQTMLYQRGDRCMFRSVVYDLQEEAPAASANVEGACTEEALLESVEKISVKIEEARGTEALVKYPPRGRSTSSDRSSRRSSARTARRVRTSRSTIGTERTANRRITCSRPTTSAKPAASATAPAARTWATPTSRATGSR